MLSAELDYNYNWGADMMSKYNSRLESHIENANSIKVANHQELNAQISINNQIIKLLNEKLKYLNVDQYALHESLEVLDSDSIYINKEKQDEFLKTMFVIKDIVSKKLDAEDLKYLVQTQEIRKVEMTDTSEIHAQIKDLDN